jgi:hypothetical protein
LCPYYDLRELQSHAVAKEAQKRSARLQKEKNQRSWDLEQLIEARAGPLGCRIIEQRERKLKISIIAIPNRPRTSPEEIGTPDVEEIGW